MTQNTMTTPPIHITPHHLSLSPALREFVRAKLAKVPRFASDLVGADIVLRRHHGTADGKQFSASARLALPGQDIHASATRADLYAAIVKLVSMLARRARKRNTRLAKNFTLRRRSVESNQPATHAIHRIGADETAALQTDDSLRHEGSNRSRRREGGQELRVFGFRRQSPFSCAPNSPSESTLHDD